MNYVQLSAFVVVVSVALVTSTPVFPIVDLNKIDPMDSCLFVCNICFDEEEKKMMRCVRDVCMISKEGRELGYLWVGRECNSYEKLQKFIFPSNSINTM